MTFQTPEHRVILKPDFYPRAHEMRYAIDAFFGSPGDNFISRRHQCFNMWFVPDHYAYLYTEPTNVLGHDLVNDFVNCLTNFVKPLGLTKVHKPRFTIYINGMSQTTHNDGQNGVYGYVFSLTKEPWNFFGGDTLIAKAGAFDELEPRSANGRSAYFESYPPRFGQLLLFDDRVAHSVVPIQGTLDPAAGRIVLNGHIS